MGLGMAWTKAITSWRGNESQLILRTDLFRVLPGSRDGVSGDSLQLIRGSTRQDEVEGVFRDRMEEKGKPIYPNVDFFSGAVYRLLGVPTIMFTPIFGVARVSGWLAHILEQRVDNRLYRPKGLYAGPDPKDYVPIDQR